MFNKKMLFIILAAALFIVGCSNDNPTIPQSNSQSLSAIIRGDIPQDDVQFEIAAELGKGFSDADQGSIMVRGRNVAYDADLGALTIDLSVYNDSNSEIPEPVSLTFMQFLPPGITILNSDNDQNGVGSLVMFSFDNDDGKFAPGEESQARTVQFAVSSGVSIGFVARVDVGMMPGDGAIGGMVWNDMNGDGMIDPDESGVGGVTIQLHAGQDTTGTPVSTEMTAEDGSYRFAGRDAGFYTVMRLPQDGVMGTTAPKISVILVEEDGIVSDFLLANFGVKTGDMPPVDDIVSVGDYVEAQGEYQDGPHRLMASHFDVKQCDGDDDDDDDDKDPGHGCRQNECWGRLAGPITDMNESEGYVEIMGTKVFGYEGDDDHDKDGGHHGNDARLRIDATRDLDVADAEVIACKKAHWWNGNRDRVRGFVQEVVYGSNGEITGVIVLNTLIQIGEEIPSGDSAVIMGLVWNDINGDGVRDEDEPGLKEATVMLTGDATAATVTDAEGAFMFDGLAAGTYEVASTGPSGWTATTADKIEVILESNDAVYSDANFGWTEDDMVEPTGFAKGTVWNDVNGDGKRDEGDLGIEGLTVVLSGAASDSLTTGVDGVFTFSGLAAGEYNLLSIGPDGSSTTTGDRVTFTLETDDAVYNSASFGWTEDEVIDPTGFAKGVVWNDVNGDGKRDEGDLGIEGLTVVLSGAASDSLTTGVDGVFTFSGLAAGEYNLLSMGPDGSSTTTGDRVTFTLETDDAVYNTASFGWTEDDVIEPTGFAKGVVWNDVNGDGKRDEGDLGIEGLTVVLSGAASDSLTTGVDGVFTFSGLAAGEYNLLSMGPDGSSTTTGDNVTFTLETDDAVYNTASFGWTEDDVIDPTGFAKGVVWNDVNGDGKRDEGDLGIEGLTVVLSGAASDSLTTGVDGVFTFSGLAAGEYNLLSMGPEGSSTTTGDRVTFTLETDDAVYNTASFGWTEDDVIDPTGFAKGTVWNDVNGDGKRDEGDLGIEGLTVVLSGAASDSLTTGVDGVFTFSGLAAGEYNLLSIGPDGSSTTTGDRVTFTLETDDAVYNTASFGWTEDDMIDPSGIIKGLVWNDINGDGNRGEDEPGLEGAVVLLAGDAVATVQTNADGSFVFENMSAGAYKVSSTGPLGWTATTGVSMDVVLATDDEINNETAFGWWEAPVSQTTLNDLAQ